MRNDADDDDDDDNDDDDDDDADDDADVLFHRYPSCVKSRHAHGTGPLTMVAPRGEARVDYKSIRPLCRIDAEELLGTMAALSSGGESNTPSLPAEVLGSTGMLRSIPGAPRPSN